MSKEEVKKTYGATKRREKTQKSDPVISILAERNNEPQNVEQGMLNFEGKEGR